MDDLSLALRAQLRTAMRDRDTVTVSVLRSVLSALDNAGAVPVETRAGAIEESAVGLGAADVARRELTVEDQRAVVASEIDERRTALLRLTGPAAERVRAELAALDLVVSRLSEG